MTSEERLQIAQTVQRVLRREHEADKRSRIDPDGIVEENPEAGPRWFYVPVDIAPFEKEMGTFYELFSRVEEALEQQELYVLLVPVRRETPAGEMPV